MDKLINDLELQLANLDNLILLPELDEQAVMVIINQLDALFDIDTVTLAAPERDILALAYKKYLNWVEEFTPRCLEAKQKLADEIRLLQRGKTATEQYQR